jgi:hypothetical protein
MMLAPLPLAASIAADIFVAIERAAESSSLGIAAGVAAICILLFLCSLQPLVIPGRVQRPKAA